MLHVIHCIQSGCFGPCCIKSTAFNHAARNPLHSIGMHFTRLHGIHCIQSGCILPGCLESMHSSHCMDSTAYNRDPLRHNAWNPLHSIRMHFNKLHGIHSVITLHGLRCIQSGSITPQCMESSAFNHAAWNPLHSIMLHGIPCIQSGCFGPCCKKIHCIQSGCIGPRFMDSSAYSRDPLHQNAWNPLHSMTLHGIDCIQSCCI